MVTGRMFSTIRNDAQFEADSISCTEDVSGLPVDQLYI